MYRFINFLPFLFIITACESGGTSRNCTTEIEAVDSVMVNEMEVSADISVFATSNIDDANFVIDGDPTEGYYWSGTSVDDYLEIDLGRVVDATRIHRYLEIKDEVNNFGELYDLLVSVDGVTWQKTFFHPSPFEDDRTYSCDTLGLTECRLRLPNPGFRYIRFVYSSVRQDEVLSVGLREIAVFSRETIFEEREVCE